MHPNGKAERDPSVGQSRKAILRRLRAARHFALEQSGGMSDESPETERLEQELKIWGQ